MIRSSVTTEHAALDKPGTELHRTERSASVTRLNMKTRLSVAVLACFCLVGADRKLSHL